MNLRTVYQIPNEPIIVAEMPHDVTFENTREHELAIAELRARINGCVYLIIDFTPCRIELKEAAMMLRDAAENPSYFWNDPQLTFIIVAHFAVANLFRHAMMQLPGDDIIVPLYETLDDALEYARCESGTC